MANLLLSRYTMLAENCNTCGVSESLNLILTVHPGALHLVNFNQNIICLFVR